LRRFQCCKPLLQQRHCRSLLLQLLNGLCLLLNGLFLLLQEPMLLLQLIQQHGGQLLILDGLNLAVPAFDHQVGINLGDLFGNQAVVDGLGAVGVGLLVPIGDRAQAHKPSLAAAMS